MPKHTSKHDNQEEIGLRDALKQVGLSIGNWKAYSKRQKLPFKRAKKRVLTRAEVEILKYCCLVQKKTGVSQTAIMVLFRRGFLVKP